MTILTILPWKQKVIIQQEMIYNSRVLLLSILCTAETEPQMQRCKQLYSKQYD